jgi:exosortase
MTTPAEADWKRWIPGVPALCAWVALAAVFVWVYLGTIEHLLRLWYTQEDYQHCFFVPLFSLFLLWYRREMLDRVPRGVNWRDLGTLAAFAAALLMFAASAAVRWSSVYFNYDIDHYSLFPLLIGLALLLGGWRGLHWAWPSIAFLVFMVPLPGFLAVMLSHPLQRIATTIGVFAIQTLGIPAVAMGTTIELTTPPRLDVAEACSGIRMLTLFFAICVGAAFVVRRPLWEKAVMVVSAIPIAIVSNATRVTVAAVLQDLVSVKAKDFFHARAGWSMMILAMLLLWGEMSLLSKLFFESPSEAPLILGDRGAEGKGGVPTLVS